MPDTPTMLVSVVIRAYNAERTLSRAIESAQRQAFPRSAFEILIIDDGSVDATRAVMERYRSDARIRLFSQPNIGAVRAANAGFGAARGRYVTLLDSDDEFEPEYLPQMTAAMERSADTAFAYCNYVEEYAGVARRVSVANVFHSVAVGCLYDRDRLLGAGCYSEGTLFPEYELLLRTWGRWRPLHVDRTLFVYHRGVMSLTSDKARVEHALAQLAEQYPDRQAQVAMIRSYVFSGSSSVRLRLATEADSAQLRAWRNDAETRSASHSSHAVPEDVHERWLSGVLNDPARKLFIAESNGVAVGTLRADRKGEGWELSWTVAPEHRKKGVGREMLSSAVRALPGPFFAEVKRDNIASLRMAEQAGFRQVRETQDVVCLVMPALDRAIR